MRIVFTYSSVGSATNASVTLDARNEVQPYLLLREEDDASSLDEYGYMFRPPELVVEVSDTSSHFDLNQKKILSKVSSARVHCVVG